MNPSIPERFGMRVSHHHYCLGQKHTIFTVIYRSRGITTVTQNILLSVPLLIQTLVS